MFSNQETTLFVCEKFFRMTRLNFPANIVSFVPVTAPVTARMKLNGFPLDFH